MQKTTFITLSLSLTALLLLNTRSEAQLKVHPDGSVHMGATTIVAPPSSSKKEALLIASSQDQGIKEGASMNVNSGGLIIAPKTINIGR